MNNQTPISPAEAGSHLDLNRRRDNNQINFKSQSPITKLLFGIWSLGIGYCLVIVSWLLVIGASPCFTQDDDRLTALAKQIIEAKASDDLYAPFEELKEIYFSENKYNEFVEFLKSLLPKKKEAEPFVDYYIALSRYSQLKHLEEAQQWEEYFSNGAAYRNEIVVFAKRAIDSSIGNALIASYAKLVLWRLYSDQEDALAAAALQELLQSAKSLPRDRSSLAALEIIAGQLFSYGQKPQARQLYRIYADTLLASGIETTRLRESAADFYRQKNLELAEIIYDGYIERMLESLPPDKIEDFLNTDLAAIAKDFSFKDDSSLCDPNYAERLFRIMEEQARGKILDANLLYLRAFNLERTKVYPDAAKIYQELILYYPEHPQIAQALYKAGLIYTYILRDSKAGKNYFYQLTQQATLSPQAISSIYQLGLLSQWEGDLVKAKDYYRELLKKARGGFYDTASLAKKRLKELNEARPIEYNLKTFLDVALGEKNPVISEQMNDLSLKASAYQLAKNSPAQIGSSLLFLDAGCTQVELLYLWSGHLGRIKPATNQSWFSTLYPNSGSKEINLVIIAPSGIVGYALDIVDVE